MDFLNYQKHPIALASILAITIAIFNCIMLSFFFNYGELILGIEIPKVEFHAPDIDLFDDEHRPPFPLPPFPHPPHIVFALKQLLSNFVLAFILFLINFQIYKETQSPTRRLILLSTIITLFVACTFSILSIHLDLHFHNLHTPHPIGPQVIGLARSTITRDIIIAVIASLSTLIMFYENKQKQISIENEMLVAENLRSRLNAITAQLDPHFLFNSLNTLKVLIKSNPEKAQDYTQQLSDIFRYTTNKTDITSVRKEIEFSLAYGNMMLMRYENNLRIIYNVNEAYNDNQILPFSIQTLIENAIKHNVITTRQPLTIEILSDNNGNIIVRNIKSPKKEINTSNGFGLKNLNDRYKYQFKREIEISNSTEYFEVKIPTIKVEI